MLIENRFKKNVHKNVISIKEVSHKMMLYEWAFFCSCWILQHIIVYVWQLK